MTFAPFPAHDFARKAGRATTGLALAAGLLALAGATFLTLPASPALAQESPVVATVGGQPITEADLTLALADLAAQFEQIPEEKKRAAALQALIEIRLVSGKGRADGTDQKPEFKQQLGFLTDRVLHQAVIDAEIAGPMSEADIRARYDKEVAARPAENEVKARHILVEDEALAKKLIADLDGGADFEKLANDNTTDPSGKTTGGDLGYFGAGMMVPEFEEAAFALTPGSYTKEPIKTQFGFHIIKVDDKRTKQPPAFDQVKDQVRNILIRERYLALVETLRTAANVEITDAALKADIEGQK
jgi:peptidyl-prolyl cis-trans isomerase C